MYRSSRKPMLTYVIIALNMIFYVYTALLSGDFVVINYHVIRDYGQYNLFVLNGWYWQLFTAMFVHVNVVHLLGNMFFLLIFGLRAEELFSVQEYFAVYFSSGLAGNLLTLLFGPSMVSAGASGAIFGLFGACTIYIKRAVGQSIMGALLFSFFWLMISSGGNVNNLAHFGGLVAGLLIGYVLASRRKLRAVYEYSYSYPRSHL
ncbi:MAG: rhomboid family intramembrane serine protease [Candidatus Bathyarchaeota archaeon]|nr:rhomboid family intramembrane serine protease [Candidatus Bathyarchaeota archaeon]